MSRTESIVNRLPHFYRSGEGNNHLYQWVSNFAQQINIAEEDLLNVMRSHWINTADNEGSKGLDSNTKGNMDKILSLFLENLGGTFLLRQTNRRTGKEGIEDDRLYRERMMGLIQVILGGPSTKSGLINIVSANLGIIGDDPVAVQTRNQFHIEEFLPEIQTETHSNACFLQRFLVNNPNPERITAEIMIRMLDISFPVVNPRVVHAATGAFWQYPGTVIKDDELIFAPDGTGLVNGTPFTSLTSGGLWFHPGENEFYLDAFIGLATGIYNQTQFDYSLFDKGKEYPLGLFDQSNYDGSVFVPVDPVADITVSIDRLHPGSFELIVPWDSPGFTVKFLLKPSLAARLDESVASGILTDPTDTLDDAIKSLKALIDTEQESMSGVLQAIKELSVKSQDILIKWIFEETEPTVDLFAGLAVNPRNQIGYIVNKVKAAGVFAVVSYKKLFVETHEITDLLHMAGKMHAITEDQDMQELNFDLKSLQRPYPNGLEQEMNDNLVLSGVFDYTKFDSMNAFG